MSQIDRLSLSAVLGGRVRAAIARVIQRAYRFYGGESIFWNCSTMDEPFAAMQRRLAILGQRAIRVRLIRPAPEGASAWICAVEEFGSQQPGADDNLFVIREADIRELLPPMPE
jgi:hypothetical protein